MEIKIKVNDKATILLDVEEEMTIAEFMGVASLVGKVDKYAFMQKSSVKEIRGKRRTFEKLSLNQKKERVSEWDNTKKEDRTKLAEKYGTTRTEYCKKIIYFKKSIGGK